jgi:hypothetical protein
MPFLQHFLCAQFAACQMLEKDFPKIFPISNHKFRCYKELRNPKILNLPGAKDGETRPPFCPNITIPCRRSI